MSNTLDSLLAMELAHGSARRVGLADSTNTLVFGVSAHSCSLACQRCVFGNLYACTVTGAEHLCDR